ncbi:unnamed protein product, partial [Brassica oleracea]
GLGPSSSVVSTYTFNSGSEWSFIKPLKFHQGECMHGINNVFVAIFSSAFVKA